MSTEIFRFVTIRPPQQIAADSTTSVIDLGLGKSPLIDSLRKLRTSGELSSMVGAAAKFTASAGLAWHQFCYYLGAFFRNRQALFFTLAIIRCRIRQYRSASWTLLLHT